MLFAKVNGKHPGHVFKRKDSGAQVDALTGEALSHRPLDRIEVIVNGRLHKSLIPVNKKTPAGGYSNPIHLDLNLKESSWIAVRCFERQPDGRERFAHTAPFHVEIAGQPVRPRKQEVDFLIRRVRDEIVRNADVLPDEALAEFREALAIYEEIAKRARP